MSTVLPRRTFLASTAGALAALSASAYAQRPSPQRSQRRTAAGSPPDRKDVPVKAISSHNGLEATRRACELMQAGKDTLEAAVAGVTLVENDPDDTSVGFGGLPNEVGVVELDAAVMHGPTHRAGAVAALQNIRNPSQVARLVMERSDHVLLVGDGALRFAKAHGFQEEDLLTEKARKIWLYWKQTLSQRDDWLPPPVEELDSDVVKFFKLSPARPQTPEEKASEPGTPAMKLGEPGASATRAKPVSPADQSVSEKVETNPPRPPLKKGGRDFERPTGTIHLAAINAAGDMSCTTTTSGLAFKIPGRVGDSPIIGAGLYVDNEVGSCGSTGRGEANLQNLCSFAAVELMRGGASPDEAGLEILRRVAKTTAPRLRDKDGRPDFGLKFYLLSKDGRHAGVSMWGPAQFAVTDAQGTRLEECVSLYTKG